MLTCRFVVRTTTRDIVSCYFVDSCWWQWCLFTLSVMHFWISTVNERNLFCGCARVYMWGVCRRASMSTLHTILICQWNIGCSVKSQQTSLSRMSLRWCVSLMFLLPSLSSLFLCLSHVFSHLPLTNFFTNLG